MARSEELEHRLLRSGSRRTIARRGRLGNEALSAQVQLGRLVKRPTM